MQLNEGIAQLKGVGDKTEKLLAKMDIFRLEDLLFHFPHAYDSFKDYTRIAELKPGEVGAIKAHLTGRILSRKAGRMTISVVTVSDGIDTIEFTFFNIPYIHRMIMPDKDYVFRGMVTKKGTKVTLQQPKLYTPENYSRLLNEMQPRYPLTKGVTSNLLSKLIRQILDANCLPVDFLPETIRKENGLCKLKEALNAIHFPVNEEMLIQGRKRLVFDEFFLFLLNLRKSKEETQKIPNRYAMIETADTVRLLEGLPYDLTSAQKKVWDEIKNDLQGKYVMNRLIQGDVGSGKTILAILAILMTVANGYQGALMAPTEVLARQHFEAVMGLVQSYHLPLRPVLLTGSSTAKEKRLIYEKVESGEANMIIGTHALIQEKVVYKHLALVVTDEQHRFGVRQREALAGKGRDTNILVMSATPIPRTLAILLYGDLHLSILDELPADRLPIRNCVVGTDYRKKAYEFMQKEIQKGRQVYIICPMVEEGDTDGLENVTDYTEKIKQIFPPQIQIASLHGKMKPAEKNRIMESFGNGDIDILVSTTVIEVGINVPNATVMMIENSERFGLAQLHQLRGRVGRGKEQSYCIFMTASEQPEKIKRLSVLNHSNDGFVIASEDLKLRGPGDLFGIRQSGILAFRLGDIYQDADILKEAGDEVDALLLRDPDLTDSANECLKKWMDEHPDSSVDFKSI